LSALVLKYISYDRRQCIIVFHIQKLLKTSRTGVAAPRNECALKILLLIPDNSNTDLSHRAKVDVVTSSKVTNEINKLDVFLTSLE
jgi:hypothetical protein